MQTNIFYYFIGLIIIIFKQSNTINQIKELEETLMGSLAAIRLEIPIHSP